MSDLVLFDEEYDKNKHKGKDMRTRYLLSLETLENEEILVMIIDTEEDICHTIIADKNPIIKWLTSN